MQKVFDLINKTGDRCIILSETRDDAYAIMSLTEYERLALGNTQITDLTEDQFLDKINRDIAVWKSQQQSDINDPELDDEHDDEIDGFISETDDNLANFSENLDFEEDEQEQEEPFYFEKV